jgi:hypothetical protein
LWLEKIPTNLEAVLWLDAVMTAILRKAKMRVSSAQIGKNMNFPLFCQTWPNI